jgi:UPF0271 protein
VIGMPRIDVNCDLGEGAGHDAELMPLITSANIACGGHTGDEVTMMAAVDLALQHGVAIGAHPGFADRENFGRREIPVWPEEVFQLVLVQTQALQRLAHSRGATLAHVKPHGALYNMAARNTLLADAVAQAVYEADPRLRLFGLAGSHALTAGRACGLEVAAEVFADRSYQPDGSLTPRAQADALIQDEDAAVAQVLGLVREGRVRATDGTEVLLRAETVCVHGDGPHAVAFAKKLAATFAREGIEARAPGA